MNINLTPLQSQIVQEIDITNTYDIPKSYYDSFKIVSKLDKVQVTGKITLKLVADTDDTKDNLREYVEASITSNATLIDSISLEEVNYPISIKYDDFLDENSKKNQNTLDIFQFLWENIVLEIPLKYTKVEDFSKFHGDGWKLISEDDLVTKENNPFAELLKDTKEE